MIRSNNINMEYNNFKLDDRGSICAITYLRCLCCVCKSTKTVTELFAAPESSNNPYGTQVFLREQLFGR